MAILKSQSLLQLTQSIHPDKTITDIEIHSTSNLNTHPEMDNKNIIVDTKIEEYFSNQVLRDDIERLLNIKFPNKVNNMNDYKKNILPVFHKYLNTIIDKIDDHNIEFKDPFPREINRLKIKRRTLSILEIMARTLPLSQR